MAHSVQDIAEPWSWANGFLLLVHSFFLYSLIVFYLVLISNDHWTGACMELS